MLLLGMFVLSSVCRGLFASAPGSGSGAGKVFDPSSPVCATVGEDATFFCQMMPQATGEMAKVAWTMEGTSCMMNLHRNETECEGKLKERLNGRAEIIRKDPADGNIALRIHNITTDDAGKYTCSLVLDTAHWNPSEEFQLTVAEKSACELENELESATIERDVLQKDRDTLETYKDVLLKERDSLLDSNDILNKERVLLMQEREILIKERDRLDHENVNLIKETEKLTEERDHVQRDKELLVKQRDNLQSENYNLIKERDGLQRFKDFLPKDAEWRQVRSYADDITMDPDTAHPLLVVSEDRKSVQRSYASQGLIDTPERYNTYSCLLGAERFTAGRHYWEVEAGGVLWYVGIYDESGNRKGQLRLSPETGYWVVGVWYGDGFWAFTSPKSLIPSRILPKKVGVFLDYEEGRVSIYNIEEGFELLRFPVQSFTRPLRPFFCTWLTNPPLMILPVAR